MKSFGDIVDGSSRIRAVVPDDGITFNASWKESAASWYQGQRVAWM